MGAPYKCRDYFQFYYSYILQIFLSSTMLYYYQSLNTDFIETHF